MTEAAKLRDKKVRERQESEAFNVFARLPVVYAASRSQGQRLLQIGGSLSIVEWRTLWDLAAVGPLTVRELATIQRADHSLISRALPEMRRKGYVTMRRDDHDGRQVIVEITPIGKQAYDVAAPIMQRRRDTLREIFSEDEIKMFIGFIDRYEDFVRQPIEQMLDKDTPE